jgi:uncharacterized lipoprotein YmbA
VKYFIMLVLTATAACSSQPPDMTRYLLRSDLAQETRELNTSANFRFGALLVADYIDSAGLVIETGDDEIHTARNHEWAEPLRVSLKTFLATEVSSIVGEDIAFGSVDGATATIDVKIDQLHGRHGGDAVLLAYWRLTGPVGKERRFQFAETEPLARDGYQALVDAEKLLLRRLARQIASSLANGLD